MALSELERFKQMLAALEESVTLTLTCDSCKGVISFSNMSAETIAMRAYFDHGWRNEFGRVLCSACLSAARRAFIEPSLVVDGR